MAHLLICRQRRIGKEPDNQAPFPATAGLVNRLVLSLGMVRGPGKTGRGIRLAAVVSELRLMKMNVKLNVRRREETQFCGEKFRPMKSFSPNEGRPA